METVRKGLEEKMSQDIDNMVCFSSCKTKYEFLFSDRRI